MLNDLLELDEPHRIVAVELLAPEQRPEVSELKLSIVDVKCRDARGVGYVVEMQVLNVEGFEKRVVYNVAKAYVGQLGGGSVYPELDDVIGVTICDFVLWPGAKRGGRTPGAHAEPLADAGAAQRGERAGADPVRVPGAAQVRREPGDPETLVEKWAYFFREAENLTMVPRGARRSLRFLDALEAARAAGSPRRSGTRTSRAGMAIQDERGALSVAHKEGEREGRLAEARSALRRVLARRGLVVGAEEEARIEGCGDRATLERWHDEAVVAGSAGEALR